MLFSAAFVRVTNTRPGYDPYGWMVWGYQTWHLTLNLGGAPSWKPVPFLFTVPYAVAGHYQLWLWMITATAVALGGTVFAARIAYRLVGGNGLRLDPDPIRRYAPWVAAFIADHMTKPVAAYIAGVTAPPGRKMGHAGAIISGSQGTAQAKMEALAEAGVQVAVNPTECGEKMVEIVRGLA